MTLRYGDVDYGVLTSSWPGTVDAQAQLLLRLRGWGRHPDVEEHLVNRRCVLIGAYILDAGHGLRWFHVWECPRQGELFVLKQPPTSSLVVQCTLAAAGQCIRAEFATLSGRVFASTQFLAAGTSRDPLLLEDLHLAAVGHALAQDLMESARSSCPSWWADIVGQRNRR